MGNLSVRISSRVVNLATHVYLGSRLRMHGTMHTFSHIFSTPIWVPLYCTRCEQYNTRWPMQRFQMSKLMQGVITSVLQKVKSKRTASAIVTLHVWSRIHSPYTCWSRSETAVPWQTASHVYEASQGYQSLEFDYCFLGLKVHLNYGNLSPALLQR